MSGLKLGVADLLTCRKFGDKSYLWKAGSVECYQDSQYPLFPFLIMLSFSPIAMIYYFRGKTTVFEEVYLTKFWWYEIVMMSRYVFGSEF